MKILLLGTITGNLDEGMKNSAFHLYQELSKIHKILIIEPRKILSRGQFVKIFNFSPEIVHYLHGPTIRSLIITKILGWCLRVKTIISATQPNLGGLGYSFLRLYKPDCFIVQSPQVEKQFNDLGCRTHFISNGVDLDKFIQVSLERKKELRKQYGVDENVFIALHIGPVRKNRNLDPLTKLQKNFKGQVIIAGSTSVNHDPEVVQELEQAGCKVWVKFFAKVEELYQLADCYLFPVTSTNGVIQFPLSVLEAMSCGIPVISTPFGALPQLFQNGDGIYFIYDFNDLPEMIEKVKNCKVQRSNSITSYSWSLIAKQISDIYKKLNNS